MGNTMDECTGAGHDWGSSVRYEGEADILMEICVCPECGCTLKSAYSCDSKQLFGPDGKLIEERGYPF